MKSLRKAFPPSDRLLLFLGLTGIVIYLVFLPRVHPDAASAYEPNGEQILELARRFTFNAGYNVSGYEWSIYPMRNVSLLDSLQARSSGRTLFEVLKDPTFENLPTYAWEVRAEKQPAAESRAPMDVIQVGLSRDGQIWRFRTFTSDQPASVREPLLQTPSWQTASPAALDSIPTADLAARFWAINPDLPPVRRNDSLAFNVFGREDAIAVASYYLNNSLLKSYGLRADSVTRPRIQDRSLARVSFSGNEPSSGMPVSSSVEVTTSGALKNINTAYFTDIFDEIEERSRLNFSLNANGTDGALRVITYILLGIFTFILFLRRLNARLVDVKGAMQDGIWGGLFAAFAVGNAFGWRIFAMESSIWLGMLSVLGSVLAAGFAGAFAVFIVSCATDSMARAVWPKRLATLTLARNMRFFNTSMGVSLIRSTAIAGILVGFSTLFLFIPGIRFAPLQRFLHGSMVLSPIIDLLSVNGLFGMLICMMLLLSLGATLYSKYPSRTLVICAVVPIAALMQIGHLKLQPAAWQWILSGSIGLTLTFALLRFDYFSCFGGFALYGILWQIAPDWLISASESQLDVVLAFGLIPAILAVGLVGLIAGADTKDSSQFLPSYLREMAQQERMRGELEIARQVHASLLPRRMPTMHGLDIAAMCLPAQEVGGDYFDFIRLDKDRLALVIGDVSGKGIQAGFFMTLTKGFLHAICRNVASPAEVLTQVNQLFCQNVPRGTFISLIYGIIDVANGTFTFARAGHDPVIHRSSKLNSPAFFKPAGMAIGLTQQKTFEDTIRDQTVNLHPEDLLIFYTDGVTEAFNPEMEQFGMDRLAQKVEQIGARKSARQVLQEVSEHIQAFVKSSGRADDMTMIVVRIAPSQDIISVTEISHEGYPWLEHEI